MDSSQNESALDSTAGDSSQNETTFDSSVDISRREDLHREGKQAAVVREWKVEGVPLHVDEKETYVAQQQQQQQDELTHAHQFISPKTEPAPILPVQDQHTVCETSEMTSQDMETISEQEPVTTKGESADEKPIPISHVFEPKVYIVL